MTFRAERFEAPSGATIRLYVSEATTPRGVVQINHGLAEHAARYAGFAAFLNRRGYHVLAHDHRGHGATQAPGAPFGRFADRDGARLVVADAATVVDLAASRFALPVIAFGHSMGGLITLNLIQAHPEKLAGAAIWNANVSAGLEGRLARALLGWEKFRLGSDMPSQFLPRLTFRHWGRAIQTQRTAFDWLSHDAAEVDAYIADPLCGRDASVSLWRDLFDLIFAAADEGRWRGVARAFPMHFVGGDQDPATNNGRAVSRFANKLKRTGFSNLETRIYADTRHESLNELNRNMIMADFAEWADRVFAAR